MRNAFARPGSDPIRVLSPWTTARSTSWLVVLGLTVLALSLTSTTAYGQDSKGKSSTSILLYDEQGRVVGSRRATETFGPGQRHGPGTDAVSTLRLPTIAPPRVPVVPPGNARPPRAPRADRQPNIDYEANEILAVSPSPGILRRAETLGYSHMESVTLDALGLTVLRLRTPTAATTRDGLELFRNAFPGIQSDFNSLIDPSLLQDLHEGARAIGWRRVPKSCGVGLRIGMIDTPVDLEHAALRGQRITRARFVPENRPEASASHGTAIAALLVGSSDAGGHGGLLPGASLLAASIFEQRDQGRTVGNLFSFLMALDWMAAEKVPVLNMSLETSDNALLSKGLDRARRLGVVMTAAAGNGGATAQPAYPAAHPEVLAVTAVSTRLVPFHQANRGDYIDFSAPGVRIWTAVPGGGGRFQSGTSLAVPFVTAVAALQIGSGLGADPHLIRNALIPNVMDLGKPGKDEIYGWGLIRFRPPC